MRNNTGLWEQLKKGKMIKPKPITEIDLFIIRNYFSNKFIYGSSNICKTEEDFYESVNHFKFLRKYNLVN